MTPNLLVSYDPSHSGSAKDTVVSVFKDTNHNIKQLKKEIDGLFSASVKDVRKAVNDLTKLCNKRPEKFKKTFHYIPIDKWCKATIKDMQKAVKGIAKDIKDKEKWKMELGKRNRKEHSIDLILKLTEVVEKPKVDLNNPDKIIRIEIIGNKAGISLLKKGELLSVPKIEGA